MIKSVINIESPRPHVYAVLADFAKYQEWLPGCVESKVISETARLVETEMTLQTMKRMTMGLRFEFQANEYLGFKMTRSEDLKVYEGSWRLLDAADGSGTVVMGEMEMDAGSMVPKFMLARMAKKSIGETVEALKRRVQMVPVSLAPEAEPDVRAASMAGPRRSKRLLHVMRVPAGYRVWLMGETFFLDGHPRR